MKSRTIIFLLFLMIPALLPAQQHFIYVTLSGLRDAPVYLSRYEKSERVYIDSALLTGGSCYFVLEPDEPAGIYSVSFDRESGTPAPVIEFIWNMEDLYITADAGNIAGSASFGGSEENRILEIFRDFDNLYEQKMGILYAVLDRYPEEDTYYRHSAEHFLELQQQRDSLIENLCERYDTSFAAKIIASYRSPIIDPGLNPDERLEFLKDHFFDRARVSQPELLYTPVYSRKIIRYLTLYRSQDMSFSEQQEAFMEAVDVIMANVSGDIDLRTFVIEYLLEGFNGFQMEEVQTHITENYVDETCRTDAVKLAMERTEGYKKMAVGQKAADIIIRDRRDHTVRLSELDSGLTLVVFWATSCGHCTKLMPKLKDWYLEERPDSLEVMAISIDSSRLAWEQFIDVLDFPWVDAHEPLGWEGRSAGDYNIYATPTMFLLDRQRRILAKPLSLRELKKEMRRLE